MKKLHHWQIKCILIHTWASLLTQRVNNLPAMWETWVQSLGWEDTLEKGKVFWPGEWTVQSTGSQRIRHDWVTFTHLNTYIFLIYFFLCVTAEKSTEWSNFLKVISLLFRFYKCKIKPEISSLGKKVYVNSFSCKYNYMK